MKSKLLVLVSVIVLASMLLVACQPKATETPVVTQPPVVETEEPTAAGPHLLWPINLRQAIAATIDREAIVDRVFEGRNIPAYSPIPIGFASLKESFLDKYGTRDIQMAKAVLNRSGFFRR